MKQSTDLVPALLQLFKQQIAPLKVANPTEQQSRDAVALVGAYVPRLQILDLSLSQGDALELLKQAYQSI